MDENKNMQGDEAPENFATGEAPDDFEGEVVELDDDEAVDLAGDEVEGDEVAGDEVEGDEVEGDEVEGDEVEGDEVEGDEVEGDEVEGDEVEGDEVGKKRKKHKRVQAASVRMRVPMATLKRMSVTSPEAPDAPSPESYHPTNAPDSADAAEMTVEEDGDGVFGYIVVPSPDGKYGIGIGFSETVEGIEAELTTEAFNQVGGFFDGFKRVFKKIGAGAGGIISLAKKIARSRVVKKLFAAAAQAAKNPMIAKMTGLSAMAFPAAGISPRAASEGLKLIAAVKQKDPLAVQQFAKIVVRAKKGSPQALAAMENLAKTATIHRQMAAVPSTTVPERDGIFLRVPSYYMKGIA